MGTGIRMEGTERLGGRRAVTAACAGVLLLSALATGCASTPSEDEQAKLADLEQRVARIERIAANEVEVSQRLDEIQETLRQLRGRIDDLEHNSEALRKQQRDLYGDLDKRLAAAGGTVGAAFGAAAGTAAGSGAPGAAATGGAAASGAAGDGGDNAGTANAPADNGPSTVEQAVYTQAFDALKAGSYSVAITGFKDFLSTYPSSQLADNAQYWLGEAYYVNRDYDSAAGAFRTVLKKWPDSHKAPDALLKLGYTQLAQKQYPAARVTLDEVARKYPGTESARLATDRLKRIPASPPPGQ
jgi:tol-pal system protein YbgF